MKLEFSRHIFEKCLDIIFSENLLSGARVAPCGWTDRQTDRHMKLMVAFRNFANAPNKRNCFIFFYVLKLRLQEFGTERTCHWSTQTDTGPALLASSILAADLFVRSFACAFSDVFYKWQHFRYDACQITGWCCDFAVGRL
jgi:hypothetical protein